MLPENLAHEEGARMSEKQYPFDTTDGSPEVQDSPYLRDLYESLQDDIYALEYVKACVKEGVGAKAIYDIKQAALRRPR